MFGLKHRLLANKKRSGKRSDAPVAKVANLEDGTVTGNGGQSREEKPQQRNQILEDDCST